MMMLLVEVVVGCFDAPSSDAQVMVNKWSVGTFQISTISLLTTHIEFDPFII